MQQRHSYHRWHTTDRARAPVIGVLVTLLLHFVFVVFLLGNDSGYRHQSSVDPRLVFAGLVAPERAEGRTQSMPRIVATTPPSSEGIDQMIPTPHLEVADVVPETITPIPDFVRRIGVITARIQGAWSISGMRRNRDFHCRVRLRQDGAGVVREVELWECDDDQELQASLLKAIRASSPLPPLDGDSQSEQDLTLDVSAYASLTAGRRSSVEPSASMP